MHSDKNESCDTGKNGNVLLSIYDSVTRVGRVARIDAYCLRVLIALLSG